MVAAGAAGTVVEGAEGEFVEKERHVSYTALADGRCCGFLQPFTESVMIVVRIKR
jgi:hypothetical protein